ncbi:MAG: A/G-specific adenine glycosylase, partial [Candidatus Sungiibacteriota bacterium]
AVPRDLKMLASLPGIGAATAGAITAFAFNMPIVFIETNIRRVYIHFFFPRRKKVPDAALMLLIEKTLDHKNPRAWYYALMDYGAMLGALQKGKKNPNRRSKHYTRQSRFEGSDRELRGKIIALALKQKYLNTTGLRAQLNAAPERIKKIVAALLHERFLMMKNGKIMIAS